MNLTCIICSDLLSSVDNAYSTNCGHIFHYHCLCQWLERSKTCPQCRNKCSDKSFHRIYFNILNSGDISLDAGALQHQVDSLKLQIDEKETNKRSIELQLVKIQNDNKKNKNKIKELQDTVSTQEIRVRAYEGQLKQLKNQCQYMTTMEKEIKVLQQKIDLMKTVESVITSTMSEVEDLLKTENNPKSLAVLVASLKRELRSSEGRRSELRSVLKSTQQDCRKEQELRKRLEEKISQIESENFKLNEEKWNLEKDLHKKMEHFDVANAVITTKRKMLEAQSNTDSPNIAEKVKKIEESDSPYLKIKSSSIGLAPLLKVGPQPPQSEHIRKKLAIFKKPRLTDNPIRNINNQQFVSNGFGESVKRDNFPTFGAIKITSTTTARVKSGKLKRIDFGTSPPNSNENFPN